MTLMSYLENDLEILPVPGDAAFYVKRNSGRVNVIRSLHVDDSLNAVGEDFPTLT